MSIYRLLRASDLGARKKKLQQNSGHLMDFSQGEARS